MKTLSLLLLFFNYSFCQINSQDNLINNEPNLNLEEEVKVINLSGVAKGLPEVIVAPNPNRIDDESKNQPSPDEVFDSVYNSLSSSARVESVPLSSIPKQESNINDYQNFYEWGYIILIVAVIVFISRLSNSNKTKSTKENLEDKENINTNKLEEIEKLNDPRDVLIQLEKLQLLKDNGTINENEFNSLKDKILNN